MTEFRGRISLSRSIRVLQGVVLSRFARRRGFRELHFLSILCDHRDGRMGYHRKLTFHDLMAKIWRGLPSKFTFLYLMANFWPSLPSQMNFLLNYGKKSAQITITVIFSLFDGKFLAEFAIANEFSYK